MKPLRYLAGALLCALLAIPAAAQETTAVTIDGVPLTPQEGWIEEGVSYITLAGLSRATGDYTLTWDGQQAALEGAGLWLTATPGAIYIEANGRALYLPQGVAVPGGSTVLPASLLAEILGGSLHWDGDQGIAVLERGEAPWADYDQESLYWLSRIITAESGGEPLLGQIAVGNVVLNRVALEKYPDTIQGVIFDTNFGVQFEPVINGTVYSDPTAQGILAAKLALEGADVVGDCIYFYAPALSDGTWIRTNNQYVCTIGCHRFFRDYD